MSDLVDPNGEATLRAEIAQLRDQLEAATQKARYNQVAADAEHARLTFELGHRVKNTLSVVQALASQTMRVAPTKEEGLEAFGARIIALARANDVILHESWTAIGLATVAESILRPVEATGHLLRLDGPAIRVNASAGLALAMALHELAANAQRHGAWTVDGGRVDLTWTVSSDNPDAGFALDWVETGGPACVAPEKRGFGLRLIDQSLKSAFGRDVTIEFPTEGAHCRIRAPLSKLQA